MHLFYMPWKPKLFAEARRILASHSAAMSPLLHAFAFGPFPFALLPEFERYSGSCDPAFFTIGYDRHWLCTGRDICTSENWRFRPFRIDFFRVNLSYIYIACMHSICGKQIKTLRYYITIIHLTGCQPAPLISLLVLVEFNSYIIFSSPSSYIYIS